MAARPSDIALSIHVRSEAEPCSSATIGPSNVRGSVKATSDSSVAALQATSVVVDEWRNALLERAEFFTRTETVPG
jgi:hypothetical protein